MNNKLVRNNKPTTLHSSLRRMGSNQGPGHHRPNDDVDIRSNLSLVDAGSNSNSSINSTNVARYLRQGFGFLKAKEVEEPDGIFRRKQPVQFSTSNISNRQHPQNPQVQQGQRRRRILSGITNNNGNSSHSIKGGSSLRPYRTIDGEELTASEAAMTVMNDVKNWQSLKAEMRSAGVTTNGAMQQLLLLRTLQQRLDEEQEWNDGGTDAIRREGGGEEERQKTTKDNSNRSLNASTEKGGATIRKGKASISSGGLMSGVKGGSKSPITAVVRQNGARKHSEESTSSSSTISQASD